MYVEPPERIPDEEADFRRRQTITRTAAAAAQKSANVVGSATMMTTTDRAEFDNRVARSVRRPACVGAGLGVLGKDEDGAQRYDGVRFHDLPIPAQRCSSPQDATRRK